ncbi:MAG: hypothetical protein U5P10_13980 [Spirochaetia bacterium]|nr:hypothetical protein [Spirochaetia bacterium]
MSEDVNSLTSDQWNTTELGLDYPYDTALDNQGRIWISYYGPYSEYYPIIMINDITSSAPDYDPEVSGSAIAFDRTNNYLYIGQPGEGSAIKFIHVTQDVSDIAVGTDTFELWQESEIVVSACLV